MFLDLCCLWPFRNVCYLFHGGIIRLYGPSPVNLWPVSDMDGHCFVKPHLRKGLFSDYLVEFLRCVLLDILDVHMNYY